MVVAANGPKIKPVKPGDPIAPLPEYFRGKTGMEALIEGKTMLSAERVGAALTGRRVSMSQLAEALQEPLRTAVLDRTGLSGNYYFSLVYARDNDPESNAPTLFTAMQEELGLRLEKQRVPVEFLVVDHIEKKPTEN
jgi:uncharacterized protein (TIGR03435 family)